MQQNPSLALFKNPDDKCVRVGLFFLNHRSAVLLCFQFGGDKKGGQDNEPVVVVVGSVVVVVGSVVVVVGSEKQTVFRIAYKNAE